MTWKAYAGVSGATVLAGWLASAPPSNVPVGSAPAAPPASSRLPSAASDIERQAARLQTRARSSSVYSVPARNPFRFGALKPAARGGAPLEITPPVEPIAPTPTPPPVSLAGIAEDQVEGRLERTAVLSSPAGVLLVHEGDEVLGQYRVAVVEEEAVQLTKVSDGSLLRLTLTP